MRNMKTLLRLLGSVSLSTVVASSVVACATKTPPEEHVDAARLLGWYDAKGNSLINQKLNYDDTVDIKKYSIIVDSSLITVTSLFKSKLLVTNDTTGSKKYKAINTDAAKLLKELGFTSGNEKKDYSSEEVTAISSLSAVVKTNNPGKIVKSDTTDFKAVGGTCQIEVKNNTVLKTFNIKTRESDLAVPKIVSEIIQKSLNAWNITFAGTLAYKQNQPVITQLPWNSDADGQKAEKQFNSLLKILGFDTPDLLWSSDNQGKQKITTYTSASAFLTIKISEIKVWDTVDCGRPDA